MTCYQPDRKLRDRIMAAIATLTTQGRAVGFCVVAPLRDPRKDVLSIRNLFPDRIAMRLDEPEQADMVLGACGVHQGRHGRAGRPPPQEGSVMASRRRFGRVRRLPSGRYQARYHGPDGIDRPAPSTFATKTDAEKWLGPHRSRHPRRSLARP